MKSLWNLIAQAHGPLALIGVLCVASAASAQQGVAFTGAGAVNRSMGGASTAAPLDASGALFWNPATIVGLQTSQVDLGVELLYPRSKLSSSLPANLLGPGVPPVALSGTTNDEAGVFPLPSIGVVFQPCDSPWTFGLSLAAGGGFGLNYPADPTNPILSPRPPNGFGVGGIFSRFELWQLAPAAAVKVTDRLSIGIAPILSIASLQVNPGTVVSPDDANGDGFATYPNLTTSRYAFGGGIQGGVYYALENGWRFGADVKSPQWLEPFRFNSQTELGQPRAERFHIDFPMIASAGVSYAGFERWVMACDVRYVDYKNTTGFRASGFDDTGALRGLGWRSTFGVACGAQYQVTDCLSLRAGYSWNQNPIPSTELSANLASTTIEQHTASVGVSYQMSENVSLSLAYLHAFSPSEMGPLTTAQGTIPGASVQTTLAVDAVVAGVSVRWGAVK